ncbi:MAG: type II toxin-antitoxin system HigB family toxin [Janthinobacterium lividum]
MRVIARSTLSGFVQKQVEFRLRASVKSHLDAWYAEVSKAEWKTSAELKQHYRSASIVSSSRVVFNIRGNDFRLVAAMNFDYQVLFIKWLGTHREYDRIDVEEVEYDEARYADPPH